MLEKKSDPNIARCGTGYNALSSRLYRRTEICPKKGRLIGIQGKSPGREKEKERRKKV